MTDEELDKSFSLANLEIKKTERVNGELVAPALSELRNASEHRARAQSADSSDAELERQKAQGHYIRAAIDAIEARIIYQLNTFKEFQNKYSSFVKEQDIASYIDAVKTAEEARNSLLRLSEIKQSSDIEYLRDIADKLESRLNTLLQNKDIIYESISKAKYKWKKGIASSSIALISSIVASVLSFYTPTNKPSDEVAVQIKSLDSVQKSLENLQSYVSHQKSTLTDLNRNVTDLKNQKAELEKIVQSNSETVNSILSNYERRQQANRWKDIVISFVVGLLSSLTAALIYEYNRRKKSMPDFDAVKDSIKRDA